MKPEWLEGEGDHKAKNDAQNKTKKRNCVCVFVRAYLMACSIEFGFN